MQQVVVLETRMQMLGLDGSYSSSVSHNACISHTIFYFIMEVIHAIELLNIYGKSGLGWRELNCEIVHNIHSVQNFNNFIHFIIVINFMTIIFPTSLNSFLFFAPSKITVND